MAHDCRVRSFRNESDRSGELTVLEVERNQCELTIIDPARARTNDSFAERESGFFDLASLERTRQSRAYGQRVDDALKNDLPIMELYNRLHGNSLKPVDR